MHDDAAIVGALDAEGAFPTPWIREAMLAVPRAAFAPDVIWHADPVSGRYTAVDRHTDPTTWEEVVVRPGPVVTQVDDGTSDTIGDLASSSLSDYRAVASFLTELDVRPGQRILEIGTGPGWTAALLAWHLGGENVVSVEIDPTLAAAARAAHTRLGLSPTVLAGDGTLGAAHAGVFDRVHATAAFTHRVPYAWIEQARPGAVIVAPWSPGFGAGALLRLVVDDDGRTASGKFVRSVAFMELRGERNGGGAAFEAVREAEPATEEAEVGWVLESLYGDGNFTHAVALRLPDVRLRTLGGGTVWQLWDTGRSWAVVDDRPGIGKAVQGGPRRLWDEVDAALQWQDEHQVHGYDFGITVEPGRQWAWAQRPDRRWEM
ncbi:methyltransferase domain-containing protein [Embleya sp. AB8]|uniref:methyltransferase domain-containing protein n=1 Tax=Embleya sp. AB8 TaxID=3156304 RepID=UPI003C78F89F